MDVRGCFWHGCTRCKTIPKSNEFWWSQKIAKNRARDQETERTLRDAGWRVIIVWEHENFSDAAALIESEVRPGPPR